MLAGAAVAALALWAGLATFGVTRWVAGAFVAAGLALAWTGLQRRRFDRGGGGPGVVTVDERRLVYWGPLTGGVMDMDNLARLDLDPGARPAHWRLIGLGGETLDVPVDARGAEALFDLFAALPGLKVEALLAALDLKGDGRVTLWRRDRPALGGGAGPRRLR